MPTRVDCLGSTPDFLVLIIVGGRYLWLRRREASVKEHEVPGPGVLLHPRWMRLDDPDFQEEARDD
jgi:hypothetical protein